MINVRQGVFHLRNEEASYLFRVKDGFLEHLHFGARAETSDAPAFAARPGCGNNPLFGFPLGPQQRKRASRPQIKSGVRSNPKADIKNRLMESG